MKLISTRLSVLLLCCLCLLFLLHSCLQDHNLPGPARTFEIPGVASVTVPNSSVSSDNIIFEQRQVPEIEDVYNALSGAYRVDKTLPKEVYLNVGPELPKNDSIKVTFNLPESFVNTVPKGYGVEVFALIYQSGGDEVLDNFDIISSTYNSKEKTLTANLPTWIFASERNSDKTYEVYLKVGTTPGENLAQLRVAASACEAGQISCPLGLNSDCSNISSPFANRTDPITGAPNTKHLGIDYRVAVGTSVYSASDGTVIESPAIAAFGNYMMVRGSDGSVTLYAHLSEKTAPVGTTIKAGDMIAKSGATGTRVTGPHLHFEYIPNGQVVKGKNRIDPAPCISKNQNGSITVRDNGNLADDAFELYLDGVFIGRTAIGASNSIAINNLRPGDKTLRIVCIIAPDNVGTYEILLNDGIVFKGDGNRFSSTLPQGGSRDFTITIPQNTGSGVKSLLGPAVSQPNAYIEK